MSNLELLAAETRSQRARAVLEHQSWEQGWRFNLPGYELLQGDIPDKLIYRLARSAPDGPNDMDERLSSHQKMDEQRETPGLLLAATGPVRFGQRLDREPR